MPSPATGVLSPFSEEIIEISAYSDMWGVYTDNFICQVSSFMSRNMRFPTMWYVPPAKVQTSCGIRAFASCLNIL